MIQERKNKTNVNTLIYGKVPPQVPDAECAILGALLMHVEYLPEVMDIIPRPECFYLEPHQYIYECLVFMQVSGASIDIITLSNELTKRSQLELVGGIYYLKELIKKIGNVAHLETHCRMVMEKYMQRELIRISGKLVSDAYNDTADVFDLLGQAEYDINALTQVGDAETISHINESVREVLQEMDDLKNGAKKYMGVPTGIYMLDQLTKGWQDTDLIVLAARPSQGKTAEMLHHILSAALSGVGVAVFSLEMGKRQLVQRLISNHSQITLEKIKTGQLTEQEQQQVNKSAAVISALPIFIDDRAGSSIQRICNKIKSLSRKGKIGMACIDYLQLASVHDSKNKNREQQIAEMSRCLKICAKDCEIPIIVLSQMNRSIDAAKRKPELSDLRESGAIEQDADIVIFIHHEQGKTWLVVRKHRNGQTDEIEVVFLGAIQKFIDPNEQREFQSFKPFSSAIQQASNSIYNSHDDINF